MKKITLMLALALPLAGFAQDTCATAVAVTSGPTYTVTAVDGTELPNPDCSPDSADTTAAEWYSFTATVNGVAIITSNLPQNEGGDTRLFAYTGECGALVCLGYNDDVDNANYLSDLTIPVMAGTTYIIAWDDYWSGDGFDFTILEAPVDCTTSIPYSTTFDDSNTFAACYTKIDGDGNGVSWIQQALDLDADGTEETFATNGTSGDDPKNDWLFTPAFALVADETYDISYVFNGANASATVLANETLTSYITNEPSSTATFMQMIATNTGITQNGAFADLLIEATTQTGSFTPTTSGNYHLAFNTTSPPDSAFLLLFSYSIEESLATPDFATDKVRMFPNPVVTELAIVNQNVIDSVEVYNLMGQKVASQSFTGTDVRLNVSDLAAGAYMVKVISGNNSQIMKVVKQ